MAIATYKKIASVTVGSGGQAAMEFTNIPNTYDDLVMYVSPRSVASFTDRDMGLKFNDLSVMTWRYLRGDGSSAASSNGSATNYSGVMTAASNTANTFGNTMIYIPNYRSNTNKSVSIDSVTENNATYAEAGFWAVLWANTSVINKLSIYEPAGSNLAQYSTATLYGIVRSN